ncbi:MAG: YitT family protein [Clostridia bacterium]|nr:YitT family protein [Clostridia bacterium]
MKLLSAVKAYFAITFGALFAALGLNLFLAPHDIVSGGASGVAVIVHSLTGFPMGTLILLINIPLFILGVCLLGGGFGLKSLYGTAIFSLLIDITAFLPGITENLLMASIFGGTLFGIGFGIIFLAGATSGGTDILAAVLHKAVPAVDVGKWIFVIDTVIILTGAVFLPDTERVLAGILALFITSFLVDYLISGANVAKVVYVISDKAQEIASAIMEDLNRGVTGISACGMYEKKEKLMLMCVVKRTELARLRRIVESADENAFFVLSRARQVTGEGFRTHPFV